MKVEKLLRKSGANVTGLIANITLARFSSGQQQNQQRRLLLAFQVQVRLQIDKSNSGVALVFEEAANPTPWEITNYLYISVYY